MSVRAFAVALPLPLRRTFDYRLDESAEVLPGCRVLVPFGQRRLVGIVVLAARILSDDDPVAARLKPVIQVLDREPRLPRALLDLCRWVADYYQQPLGEVLAAALPGVLRRGREAGARPMRWVRLTGAGREALARPASSAKVQRALLEALAAGAVERRQLFAGRPGAAGALRRLLELGQAAVQDADDPDHEPSSWIETSDTPPDWRDEQRLAIQALSQAPQAFSVSLLEGVTGSGKTEVYLGTASEHLRQGGHVLMLVPEIALTPQLLDRVRARLGARVAAYHSGLGDAERARVWTGAAAGRLPAIVGTRSAVFVPLPRLSLIVIDEEHDGSFKQQEGIPYSARDVAIVRARAAGATVVLGTATPSLETLRNARSGRYRHLRLEQRAGTSAAPRFSLIDLRGLKLRHGLSAPLLTAIGRHLDEGGQALLFVNRRGYAPVLLCHDCGWTAPCRDCDARMAWHRSSGRLHCHHCGASQALPAVCPICASSHLVAVGQGTERVESALAEHFPGVRCERFDSDRLRQSSELERLLADTHSGAIRLLVGTQVLAKGHDFAGLTLVGVVSVDQALYSADFRALEQLGQLLTQVSGRAGRADKAGEVILQTHEPDHPMLRRLLAQGYGAFADSLLAERRRHGLPPFANLALLRADAPALEPALRLLEAARRQLDPERLAGIEVLGPVPAPMERRAGRHRAQLLLRSPRRSALRAALRGWAEQIETLPEARHARWTLDVDPLSLF